MATQNTVLIKTFTASGNNFSAATDQFIFASLVSDGGIVEPSGANDNAIGITQDTAKTGTGIPIAMVGTSKLRLGATLKAGDNVVPVSAVDAVLHVGALPASARVLEAGVSGDVVEALITHTAAAT